ncbi:MAG: hypothetical protein P8M19_02840 [Crocinitomicaceae bacterium]|jgi:hypothetical protein|nr:hypothetical protein [Crocinitomicaceae bacterium]MDG1659119.1 hypothetical protein [Crocinitomicaceae bacterium]MDG2440584.1 hypothetical protein [Crocinitomicaceae bacterium]|tara:strand:+ start:40 stop:210 length:171 start_codon:yes stop_codon:yes gene_type:complete
MSSFDFFWGLGDFLQWMLSPLDSIGNVFNYACIALGFVGLFIWLKMQNDYNKEEFK